MGQFLLDLQDGSCFYCNKSLRSDKQAVDHFVPWSVYSSDTGHNFVLADTACNGQKSDFLAAEVHLERWLERNGQYGALIQQEVGSLGFLTDMDCSHGVARWAYSQALDHQYLLWDGKNKALADAQAMQHMLSLFDNHVVSVL